MTSMTLPALTSENGLSRYLQEIWKFPILEKEQEYTVSYTHLTLPTIYSV